MTNNVVATPDTGSSPSDTLATIDGLRYPTKRDEAWRYAPHKLLERLSFGPPAGLAGGAPATAVSQLPTLDGLRVVIVNGVIDDAASDLAGVTDGVTMSTLADHQAGSAELVDSHFAARSDKAADAFAVLNATFGHGGVVIDIAEGYQLDAPIHIVNVTVPDEAQNASCSGAVVHLHAGSSATLVETRIGAGDGFGGLNTKTSITLDANATLEHIVLQDMPSAQVHLGHIDVTQEPQSTFRARSFNLGSAYSRVAYDVHLAGAEAHVDMSGLYYGTGEQTLDQQITVIHGAKDCTSVQSFRGVLDDASTGVFNGGIDVRPGADGTDAQQSNDNLLLSDRAETNTQPRLEILADDVACKHGATVGQLDDSALYYLRTRGIPASDARRLLVAAFADQVVEDVGVEVAQEWIRDRLGSHVS